MLHKYIYVLWLLLYLHCNIYAAAYKLSIFSTLADARSSLWTTVNKWNTKTFALLGGKITDYIIIIDISVLSTLGTISRHTYQQSTTQNPVQNITTTNTAGPNSVLANIVTFGYVSYRIVYSKWNINGCRFERHERKQALSVNKNQTKFN